MSATFTSGPDVQCSSGPVIDRAFHVTDIWPVGADGFSDGTAKATLADGDHPVIAISQTATDGVKTGRPRNLTGVVVSYESNSTIVQVNLAEKVCVKNYVSNVDTYSGSAPHDYLATFYIGQPVYVDDSTGLGAGVTLSTSNTNVNGHSNPLAGYLWYCQDEYLDSPIGGPNTASPWVAGVMTVAADTETHVQAEYCILLTNDYGTGDVSIDGQ